MAGEVVAAGGAVKDWKVGERICSNFAINHVSGDVTAESTATSLEGAIDGVLAEYEALVPVPERLSYEEASNLLAAAKKLGAAHAINYKATNDWDDEVLKATNGTPTPQPCSGSSTASPCARGTSTSSALDMVRPINAVKLKPVIDQIFDFEHACDAYEYQGTKQHVGKIVIKASKN